MSTEIDKGKAFEILVVDDDDVVTLIHNNVLKLCGAKKEPVSLRDGKEAIDHIEKRAGERDVDFLVLLDLNMPVMDGWEFLEECRRKPYANRIRVVVVTSSTYRGDLMKALSFEQVIDFWKKPIGMNTVKKISDMEEVRDFFNCANS